MTDAIVPEDTLARALSVVADTGRLLVMVLTLEGVVTAVSGSVHTILGWEPSELIGRDILDLVHHADRDAVINVRRGWAGGLTEHIDVRVHKRHGGWRVLEAVSVVSVDQLADDQPPTHAHPNSDVVVQAWDVTQRWRRMQTLAFDAAHDPLTQLPNRTQFAQRLRLAQARQQRHGTTFALIYLDLDGFKEVNDRHGHIAGDRLLQDAASVLADAVREQDLAARLSGDEFALIVEDLDPGTAAQQGQSVLDRARAGLAQIIGPIGASQTASAGLLVVAPTDTRSPEALLEAADQAMYRDKRARRNHRSVR